MGFAGRAASPAPRRSPRRHRPSRGHEGDPRRCRRRCGRASPRDRLRHRFRRPTRAGAVYGRRGRPRDFRPVRKSCPDRGADRCLRRARARNRAEPRVRRARGRDADGRRHAHRDGLRAHGIGHPLHPVSGHRGLHRRDSRRDRRGPDTRRARPGSHGGGRRLRAAADRVRRGPRDHPAHGARGHCAHRRRHPRDTAHRPTRSGPAAGHRRGRRSHEVARARYRDSGQSLRGRADGAAFLSIGPA